MNYLNNYEDYNEKINWKKALSGLALVSGLALSTPVEAQNVTPNKISQTLDSQDKSFVVNLEEKISKDKIYNRTIKWVSETFKSMDVIKFKENEGEAAKVSLTFIMNSRITSMGNSPGHTKCDLEISIKDNKYKVEIGNIIFEGNPGYELWTKTYDQASTKRAKVYQRFVEDVDSEIANIINNYEFYITSGDESEDDW